MGVRRVSALAAAALAGAAAATILGRRLGAPKAPEQDDPRAEELRRKLDEARLAQPDEDDFEAAGMGAETMVVEQPRPAPPPPAPRPPSDEFEAMRRRIHEEGRAAAEEMRESPER